MAPSIHHYMTKVCNHSGKWEMRGKNQKTSQPFSHSFTYEAPSNEHFGSSISYDDKVSTRTKIFAVLFCWLLLFSDVDAKRHGHPHHSKHKKHHPVPPPPPAPPPAPHQNPQQQKTTNCDLGITAACPQNLPDYTPGGPASWQAGNEMLHQP